jgi:hypothetical protein
MMTAKHKNISERLRELTIISNDDVKILDFLADLKDREPLRALQRFINFGNNQRIALLFNCPQDNLVVLVLYLMPLPTTKTRDTKLTIFADRDLVFLATYFLRWLDTTKETYPEQKDTIKALQEINDLLYSQLNNEKSNNTQPQKLE